MDDVGPPTAEDERSRLEGEYRRLLRSSVAFERKIRERWRERCREKDRRIAALEARVSDLERRPNRDPEQEL